MEIWVRQIRRDEQSHSCLFLVNMTQGILRDFPTQQGELNSHYALGGLQSHDSLGKHTL